MIDEAAELYDVAPEEFVARRDALARRLRADGRREDAAEVAELRRPTPVVWALNRTARDHPDLLDRAMDAISALREATEAAVGGSGASLRSATAEEREATRALLDAAAAVLGDRGDAARTRMGATLRAAVTDDELGGHLRRGVLAAEHDEPAFGGLDIGGLTVVPPPKPARSAAKEKAKEQEAGEREERRRRAKAAADAERFERRAERLTQAADRAEAEAGDARAAADAAAREAADARAALDR